MTQIKRLVETGLKFIGLGFVISKLGVAIGNTGNILLVVLWLLGVMVLGAILDD